MAGIKITIGSQMVEVLPVEKPTLASVKPGELTASGTCGKYYVRDANGGIVFETGANFHDKPFTEDEACANARELVSRWNSQPELLAALKDLIFATAKVESTIAEAALKNARAMLAKAHAKGCNL